MKLTAFSPVLITLGLAACGGDDGGVTPVVDAARVDAAQPIDAAGCTISTPSFGDKGALTATAVFAADPNTPALYKIAFGTPLEAGTPSDFFTFEIYTGYAPFGTQAAPTPAIAGTYPISGNQLQYADCSVCLTMVSNATADGYDDDFMATGGTVTINQVGNAVGGMLNVTFSNLTFEQVTFNGSTSTPVGNNCNTAITNATFTGVMAAPMNKPHQTPWSLAKSQARGLN